MKLILEHDHKLPTGVLGLALATDEQHAFTSCADGTIHDLDLSSGNSELFQGRHRSFASGCALLPDGRTLISAGYDGMLLWHDVATRTCWRRVQAHQFWNWNLALSPNGQRLATVTGQYLPGSWKYEPADESEPSVKVFDTTTGRRVAAFSHTPPVLSCAFSPDGTLLAAANMMGEVRVWDLSEMPLHALNANPIAQWTSPDFTSWGSVKSHHYCGGIYSLAFAPDGQTLLGCGMGPMRDPMAGNGKMTWQRWHWKTGEKMDEIKDGQYGSGLMETIDWQPGGEHFIMAGRQAQGTWNAAVFSAADGQLTQSIDTKKRITRAKFTSDGQGLLLVGANGQPKRKEGIWGQWGRVHMYRLETSS